ncbi:hypothetical protein [Microbacterium sp. BH-3-3-3]|nr:hypothetical protein [Microbacterium sp. BH-3-3-3]
MFELLDLIERQVAGTFINACVGVTPADWVDFIMNGTPRPV